VAEEPRSTEEVLLDFLDHASKAPNVVEINIAAGIALNELRGIDSET
jgi:hypothetical protein